MDQSLSWYTYTVYSIHYSYIIIYIYIGSCHGLFVSGKGGQPYANHSIHLVYQETIHKLPWKEKNM